MRLLGYYIVHTVKNCIKKLFRTWVALLMVFILLCAVGGGFIGYLVGSSIEDATSEEQTVEEEESPGMDMETVIPIVDLVSGGVILLILLWSFYNGDKSGSLSFTMPDVNFLFPAPMKPQSVLMFRVLLQMGVILVGSVYLVFQLPNLILNLGLNPVAAVFILLTWFFTLALGKLIAVCTYTVTATYPKTKKFVRPVSIGILAVVVAALFGTVFVTGLDVYSAATRLFSTPASFYVPGWGWLKGIAMFAVQGNFTAALVCMLATFVLGFVFAFAIWRIKADFYEDALGGAAKNQERLAAAAEGRSVAKKYSEKVKREDIGRGAGAQMFFVKTAYNRKRFAKFGIFTNMGLTYLLLSGLVAIFTRFVMKTDDLFVLAVALIVTVFIRNYGNPIAIETEKPFLYLVPESPAKKLLFSLLSGTYETALDLLPGFIVGAVLVGANPVAAVCWFVLLVSLDLISSATGLFIEMLIPSFLALTIKAMLQLILKMFAVIPLLVILVTGYILSAMIPAVLIAAAVNIVLAAMLFSLCPMFLHKGKN